MKTIKTALQHIICASALAFLAASMSGRAALAGVPAPAFRPVLSTLIGHTTIPILLPSWLPAEATGRWADSLANADSYDVWLPNKSEHLGNAPHDWHTVEAERVGPKTPPVEGVRVALSGGRVGYYLASEWAARPSPATVTWTQRGVQYMVSEYAGTKEDVVRMANSVVRVGGGMLPLFRPMLTELSRTKIRPVLLPTYLPLPGGFLFGRRRFKPDVGAVANDVDYDVDFSSRADVDEPDVAYFEAERLRPDMGTSEGVPVNLPLSFVSTGLTQAYYAAPEHGNSSSLAQICWDFAGTRYTIRWLGGSRMQMIRMAESCVPVTFEGSSGTRGKNASRR